MLTITIPGLRTFNEDTMEFTSYSPITLKLEHSLLSVRRWESKWHKSYFTAAATGMTIEENVDYVRCMCLDQSISDDIFRRLTRKNFETILAYLNEPMTATVVREPKRHGRKQTITAEVIYQIMIEHGIPFECEKWHLNQLLTLIKVCNVKGTVGKKQSADELAAMYKSINAARRQKTGSRG